MWGLFNVVGWRRAVVISWLGCLMALLDGLSCLVARLGLLINTLGGMVRALWYLMRTFDMELRTLLVRVCRMIGRLGSLWTRQERRIHYMS